MSNIYDLPVDKRKDKFNEILRSNKEPVDLTEYRLDALKEMRGNCNLKLFTVYRPYSKMDEDYNMAIVAKNELSAECIARSASIHFQNDKNLIIVEVDMSKEDCIMIMS